MSDTAAPPAPIGIIAGGGSVPFAVAETVEANGGRAILFALRGFCDKERVKAFRHHWIALGQLGRFLKLARSEGCHDLVFIGTLVRPAISELRLDWETIRVIPRVVAAFRGGDDHLLTGVGRIFEQHGFRLIGASDVAPQLLMPDGRLTAAAPDAIASSDMAKGRALLDAIGPFDVGQAVVVIDGHVVAMEDIEGTDALLARVARLRSEGRIRAPKGKGVLVKLPKPAQDRRFDMPTLGPRTIEGVVAAGLAGIAVAAGGTLLADAQEMVRLADKAGLFITGWTA